MNRLLLIGLTLNACQPHNVEYPDDSLACGTGTHEEDGACVADAPADTAAGDADGDGYSVEAGDCDDADPTRSPGATEACNAIDDDCDGAVDEDAMVTYYRDGDDDGYGTDADSVAACSAPEGYAAASGDCDDNDDGVSPSAQEVCSGRDEDCDGLIDHDDDSMEGYATWYLDNDGDGHGVDTATVQACETPTGYAANDDDCDDNNAGVSPSAAELCDGADQDCDTLVDEDAVDAVEWFADADGDGFGDPATSTTACDQPADYVADSADCDDADGDTNPDAAEVCSDGIDNDCDGAATGCGISGSSSLADASVKITGTAAEMHAGIYVAVVDDVTGDGVDDAVVSQIFESTYTGAAYVVSTPSAGTSSLSSYLKLEGETAMGYAGSGLGGGGDLDGDGDDDLLIGAPYLTSTASQQGRAYVLYGPVAATSLASADVALTGTSTYDMLGWSLAGLGDVDGDGQDDLAVSAEASSLGAAYAGAAYVVSGAGLASGEISTQASLTVYGRAASDYVGASVCAIGDVNGDGTDDLAIGAYGADGGASDSGAVYVVYLPQTGSMSVSMADATLEGGAASDFAGLGLSGEHDANGDGTDDVLVSAHQEDSGGSNAGAAYLFTSVPAGSTDLSAANATFVGANAEDKAATSVALVDDLDSDGVDDIAVGAPGNDDAGAAAGAAYVYFGGSLSGSLSLGSADAIARGENAGDAAGISIAGGDLNGDGVGDLLVGARYEDAGGIDAGAAYVLFGGGL